MNRRNFLASVAALPATALFPEVLSQSEQQITHVDTKTGGPLLQGSVVKAEGILPEGAAPRARSYIEFNGPTEQLAKWMDTSTARFRYDLSAPVGWWSCWFPPSRIRRICHSLWCS